MSKSRYYYPIQEQQRKASPWNVLLAIVFALMVTIGFACLGLICASTLISQDTEPGHGLMALGYGGIGGACIGSVLAILVILAIVLWRRFSD